MWLLFEEFGVLFIRTSGHTGCEQISKVIFIYNKNFFLTSLSLVFSIKMDAHISFDLKEIDLKVRPGANPIKKIFNINLHYAGFEYSDWLKN